MRVFRLFSLLILLATAGSAFATPQVQTLWRLLDYIAVDYSGAVSDGAVISDVEYGEMTEFSATVREGLAGLPEHPSRQALEAQAGSLTGARQDDQQGEDQGAHVQCPCAGRKGEGSALPKANGRRPRRRRQRPGVSASMRSAPSGAGSG